MSGLFVFSASEFSVRDEISSVLSPAISKKAIVCLQGVEPGMESWMMDVFNESEYSSTVVTSGNKKLITAWPKSLSGRTQVVDLRDGYPPPVQKSLKVRVVDWFRKVVTPEETIRNIPSPVIIFHLPEATVCNVSFPPTWDDPVSTVASIRAFSKLVKPSTDVVVIAGGFNFLPYSPQQWTFFELLGGDWDYTDNLSINNIYVRTKYGEKLPSAPGTLLAEIK